MWMEVNGERSGNENGVKRERRRRLVNENGLVYGFSCYVVL